MIHTDVFNPLSCRYSFALIVLLGLAACNSTESNYSTTDITEGELNDSTDGVVVHDPHVPAPVADPILDIKSQITITGTDTANVTEDVDPDGDNLLEVSGKLTITDPDATGAIFVAARLSGLYGDLTIDAAGNWQYSANNKLSSIQNLNSGATITDTLTVSSSGGVTHDIVITIAGADEAHMPADITLSWVAPVEREDGTPISMSEIAGYRVYYGTSEGSYTNQVEIADSATMQVTLGNLTSDTYYIVVTTHDMDGRESAYSPMISRTI